MLLLLLLLRGRNLLLRVRRKCTDRWRLLLLLLDVVLQLDAVHRRGHEIRCGRMLLVDRGMLQIHRMLVGGFWYVVSCRRNHSDGVMLLLLLLLWRGWLLVMLHLLLLLLLLMDGI